MGLFFWICNYFSVEEFIIIPIWAFIKMADEQDPEIVVSLFQIQVRRFYLEHIDFLKKKWNFFSTSHYFEYDSQIITHLPIFFFLNGRFYDK